ncbi:MAG: DinB family protein [Acidobacteriota bacterium]
MATGAKMMSTIDSLMTEFEREAQTTRKHLERLPNDQLDYRPHDKSFTAGALASHITDLLFFAELIFNMDEVDFDPAVHKPFQAKSVADLLQKFDENVGNAKRTLANATEADLGKPWRFKVLGRLLFERPKGAAFRDFTLSHQIHHRGQFSVYLRLLNVPVPSTYGPTADEPF